MANNKLPAQDYHLHEMTNTVHSYNKTKTYAVISQIYFWNKTPNVSDSSSVHHQEFFTVHTAMVYVTQIMLTDRKQSE